MNNKNIIEMVEILSKDYDDVIAIRISGEITDNDYKPVVNLLENRIEEYGKVNLYCEIDNVEEIEQKALWKDLKFDIRHFSDFEKVALVGDKQWLEWGAKFARPFTTAKIKLFDTSEREQARLWVNTKEHA